jgi:hypothetical protein
MSPETVKLNPDLVVPNTAKATGSTPQLHPLTNFRSPILSMMGSSENHATATEYNIYKIGFSDRFQ